MTPSLRFRPEATEELAEAQRWYEQQRSGLGDELVVAVGATVELIRKWPHGGGMAPGVASRTGARRMSVHGFPYHVVYLVTEEVPVVLAVAHDRRRPGYWRGRAEG